MFKIDTLLKVTHALYACCCCLNRGFISYSQQCFLLFRPFKLIVTFIFLCAVPFSSIFALNNDDTDIYFDSTEVPPESIILLVDNSLSMEARRLPYPEETYDPDTLYPKAEPYRIRGTGNLRDLGLPRNFDIIYISTRGDADSDLEFKFGDANKIRKPRSKVACQGMLNQLDRNGFYVGYILLNNANNEVACRADASGGAKYGVAVHPNWVNWRYMARDQNKLDIDGNPYGDRGIQLLDLAKEAIVDFINDPELQNTKVGLALFQNKTPGRPSNGGFIAYPAKLVKDHKEEFIDELRNIRTIPGTPLGDTLSEVARYLDSSNLGFGRAQFGIESHPDSFKGTDYISPLRSNPSCLNTNKFESAIVMLTDGAPAGDQNRFNPLQAYLDQADPDTAYNCNKPTPSLGFYDGRTCASEFARYINDKVWKENGNEHRVRVSTIGFSTGDVTNGFLQTVAQVGGGQWYPATRKEDLINAFKGAFNEVSQQTIPSSAPSTPSSAGNRFSNGNITYFNLFQASKKDRWDGNLKAYKLQPITVNGNKALEIVGANGSPVLTSSGTISQQTSSFWKPNPAYPQESRIDGPQVAMGGARAALQLPRKLTLSAGNGGIASNDLVISSGDDNDISEIRVDELNVQNADEREAVMRWLIGDFAPNTPQDEFFIADPLHSTPLAVNYPNNRQVVFYGTNLGSFHAVDSGNINNGQTENGGNELFMWMHRTQLSNATRYYQNKLTSVKAYGLDGPSYLHHIDTNDNGQVDANETAIVIIGQRRGGRAYYAFDVSRADNIRFKWRIEAGIQPGFDNLGQTWSPMTPGIIRTASPAGIKRVLFFGGGYDPSQDRPNVPTGSYDFSDQLGRQLYMIDPSTGELLLSGRSNSQRASIVAAPAAGDVDGDGITDLVVTVDTAGQVHRFDITGDFNPNAANNNKVQITHVANLIEDQGRLQPEDRLHFFAAPEIALSKVDGTQRLSIVVGSGRRPDLLSKVLQDRLYVIRQASIFGPPDQANTIRPSELASIEIANFSNSNETNTRTPTVAGTVADNAVIRDKGYYINMQQSPDAKGEKILGKALIDSGQIIFTSYIPEQASALNSCSLPLGRSRLYVVDLMRGGTSQVFEVVQKGPIGDIGKITIDGQEYIGPAVNVDGTPAIPGRNGVIAPGTQAGFIKFWIERGAQES